MKDLKIIVKQEYEIEEATESSIISLLKGSFPGFFKDRSYTKQLPTFRILIYTGTHLIAHSAIEYRIIKVNRKTYKIFGIMDLCVKKEYRNNGLGGLLLTTIESIAVKKCDFIVLFADEHNLYNRHGFNLKMNNCRWLGISQYSSIGIINKQLKDCFMIKEINGLPWPNGTVDFLGFLF